MSERSYMTPPSRESGIYWVKDHRTNEFTIAKWVPHMNWWVLAWVDLDDPAYSGAGVVSDARFSEIGPKIEMGVKTVPGLTFHRNALSMIWPLLENDDGVEAHEERKRARIAEQNES